MNVLWIDTTSPVITIIAVDNPDGHFMFERWDNLVAALRLTETIDGDSCYAHADEFTIPDGSGFSPDEIYLMWIEYYFYGGGWDYKPPVKGEWYNDYA